MGSLWAKRKIKRKAKCEREGEQSARFIHGLGFGLNEMKRENRISGLGYWNGGKGKNSEQECIGYNYNYNYTKVLICIV